MITANVPCIIGVGHASNSCIILTGNKRLNRNNELIPNLPLPDVDNTRSSVGGSKNMVEQGKTILFCGDYYPNVKICVQLDNSLWKKHSSLKQNRSNASFVSTKSGFYIFGGTVSPNTYEYLAKGSNQWQMGQTQIPKGFDYGCAIALKSRKEVWLFGGWDTPNRILSFDVGTHSFRELPQLLKKWRKYGKQCAYIPGTNKIIITGGSELSGYTLNSTEIIDTDNGTVTIGSPMNARRSGHGIGIISIDNRERLVVFGGIDYFNGMLDSVELYNEDSKKWEFADIKLNEGQCIQSFVSTKLGNII